MGGAVGHICHLYDNPDLTFDDIKNIIFLASEGKLQKVTEKFDGINLMFTFDVLNDKLFVARTKSEIKKGGLDYTALMSKFDNRGDVQDAFEKGYNILNSAIKTISEESLFKIFSVNGNKWYSIELIYNGLSNTINYDMNNIVLHAWPTYLVDENSIVEQFDENDLGFSELNDNIRNMTNAVSERHWAIHGPSLVRLKDISNGKIATKAHMLINDTMTMAGVNDKSTIREYIYNLSHQHAVTSGLINQIAVDVANRVSKSGEYLNLTKLKKKYPGQSTTICGIVKSEIELKKKWLRPIEFAIHDFSIEILKGLSSALISDSKEETERMKIAVQNAITRIQASNDDEKLDALHNHMLKLKNIENIASPIEGVVFVYKGQAYKFTGAFAPAHQILSLLENRSDKFSQTTGKVFLNKTSPIKLDEYKPTLSTLRKKLKQTGCTLIEEIGSSGKCKVSSDIDLVVEVADKNNFIKNLIKSFGKDKVKHVGSNISVLYPIKKRDNNLSEDVQIDLMLGNTQFIKWARFGASTIKEHKHYSPVKSVLRNLFLNHTLRVVSEHALDESDDKLKRTRYIIDFDRGLYLAKQTKKGVKTVLKNWKTLERKQLCINPDEVVDTIFGEGFDSRNTLTFEQVLYATLMSEKTNYCSGRIINDFMQDLEQYAAKNETKLFSVLSPYETIDYIKSLLS